jgi:hypothetical protein
MPLLDACGSPTELASQPKNWKNLFEIILDELRSITMSKQDTIENEEAALLNDLIEQQHISPINNLDEISKLWPANDDPDLLLEYVLSERIARRQLNTERERIG